MHITRLLLPMLLLACTLAATAHPLQIMHAAPSQAGVEIRIGDSEEIHALEYLGLSSQAIGAGLHRVRVHDAASGAMLIDTTFGFDGGAAFEPLMVLAGGGAQPLQLLFHSRSGVLYSAAQSRNTLLFRPAILPPGFSVQMLNVAAVSAGSSQLLVECRFGAGHYAMQGPVPEFARGSAVSMVGEAYERCGIRLAHPQTGTLLVAAAVPDPRTMRMLIVGDGAAQPFELVIVHGGRLLARAGNAPVVVGTELDTRFAWFDADRPSQAVSLFEVPGADHVFGTWMTFDDGGRPLWYMFEGVRDGVPRRRELRIFEPRGRDAIEFVTRGSGTLFYIDCNNAELRMVVNGSPQRTLRVKRAAQVATCPAIDD